MLVLVLVLVLVLAVRWVSKPVETTTAWRTIGTQLPRFNSKSPNRDATECRWPARLTTAKRKISNGDPNESFAKCIKKACDRDFSIAGFFRFALEQVWSNLTELRPQPDSYFY
ncbi:hypothetical protein-transmembrane prediction [Rhodopirellula baltica SH 1]|uniref:Uncharacterized protein n=1 Tax=Rhodopirellula baltica (strain DSM 10527 / NCIMB 13988 / SH1) TaxID=243090 RepID=Q7UIJ4_RHOBA|nr:hypothetical protein-transmembrane prediction [Rhodopirellula baltica SH 1]